MTALDQAFIRAYGQPADISVPAVATTCQTTFRPALQVDHFRWPKICSRLTAAAPGELSRLADALAAAKDAGQKILALASCQSGEGTTTLLLCLGQLLAEQGPRVVLVDANLADPQLARRLGLVPENGWEDVLAGRVPLEEVVIESADGLLALLPVREPLTGVPGPRDEITLKENFAALQGRYDLILVDWGSLERQLAAPAPLRGIGHCLDGLVLVHNLATTGPDHFQQTQRAAIAIGLPVAGVIQNFIRAC